MYDESSEDGNLNRQAKYVNETGLCPICQMRESGIGITCGDWGCINHWLPGGDKTILINKTAVVIS